MTEGSWLEIFVMWCIISFTAMFFYMLAAGLDRKNSFDVFDVVSMVLFAPASLTIMTCILLAAAVSVWLEDRKERRGPPKVRDANG